MLNGIKACIFDMDGTIIDSMGLWHDIDIAYFEKYNKRLPDDYQSKIEGMSMRQTAVFTRETYGFSQSVDEIVDEWNQMAHDYYATRIEYKDNVVDFFEYLIKKGIKLGVATSNSRFLFDALSDSIGLGEYMDVVVTGEDVVHGKPDPECYITAAGRLGVSPDECLVFEDIIVGLNAAKSAGMKTCAVADSYSVSQWDKKVELADFSIKGFIELIDK